MKSITVAASGSKVAPDNRSLGTLSENDHRSHRPKSWLDCEIGEQVTADLMPPIVGESEIAILRPPAFGLSGIRPRPRHFKKTWCRNRSAMVWERVE